MLSLEKEEQVRALLSAKKMKGREIARAVGVTHSAVQYVRRMCNAVHALDESQRESVRDLFFAGFPIRAIEMRSKLPRSLVRAIRRYYYLRARSWDKKTPRKCPACGGMMFPKKKNRRLRVRKRLSEKALRCNLTFKDIEALYNLAADIVELGDLRLVSSPLFYDLAQCAEEIITRINNEKKQAHAA